MLIHQPIGGSAGQASDVELHAREILQWRERLNQTLSDQTGRSLPQVTKDTDRDFFVSPEEALQYGLIDEVIGTEAATEDQEGY
jgi:ATP-dependent Clp protease protease subunit